MKTDRYIAGAEKEVSICLGEYTFLHECLALPCRFCDTFKAHDDYLFSPDKGLFCRYCRIIFPGMALLYNIRYTPWPPTTLCACPHFGGPAWTPRVVDWCDGKGRKPFINIPILERMPYGYEVLDSAASDSSDMSY